MTTAVLSGLIGAATSAWQVGVLRAGAWAARGLRVPSRNALLADVVPAGSYGRAYGFERAMDNVGAIGGPLLALALVALVGVRTAVLLSIIPGLLAVGAILYAIRHTPKPTEQAKRRLAFKVRPVLRGQLGRFLSGVTLFEAANMAATLMILRATDLLTPEHGHDRAVELAIVLYVVYNLAATLVSIPGGAYGDRSGMVRVFGAGVACFALAYAGLAVSTESVALLAVAFAIAGVGIGFVETAEHAAVATYAADEIRGSSSGCSRRSRASATSPPASSSACSTRLSRPASRSGTRARSWSSRWSSSQARHGEGHRGKTSPPACRWSRRVLTRWKKPRPADCAMCAIPTSSGSLEGVKTIATGKLNQVAARLGDQAPMAATCCNACRTCVQTNAIALGLAAVVGAGAWVARLFG